MKIVLAAEGTRGDIHPMLALGRRLQDAGHDARVCGPPDFVSDAAGWDVPYEPMGEPVEAYMVQLAGIVHGVGIALMREAQRYVNRSLAWQFEGLMRVAQGADVVVSAGVHGAGASAAELHGAAYHYVMYCPVLVPSREHPPFMLPFAGTGPRLNHALNQVFLRLFSAPLRRQVNRHRHVYGLPPVRDIFTHLFGTGSVLAADGPLAPCPVDAPFPVAQIPCLHPYEGGALPEKLEHFLASGPPPVYLGFGSMPDADPVRTTRMVLDAVEATGCRALLSRGWAQLGGGALPAGVETVGSVPHAALFPRTAAVVHHGGAGTTHAAARAGVPQIVVPHLLDQYYWAHRVSNLGLGAAAPPRRKLDTGTLARLLRETLDNEVLAERAHEFGARLRAEAEDAPAVPRFLAPANA